MLFPGTQTHIHWQEMREGCRTLLYGATNGTACLGSPACSSLPFPTGRFGCWVYLLLLLLLSPTLPPALWAAFAQISLLMGHRCPRQPSPEQSSRAGAQSVCIFNVLRPAHLLLRRRRESVHSSKQAAGRKTFRMRNKGGDPERSCSQRWWIWCHLGSL